MTMKKITSVNNYYRSSDLALVAFLSLSYRIEAIDREPSGKAFFMFEKTDELEIEIAKYWSRQSVVEPQTFFNQLKTIKARIYSQQ
jgi:hypothetical protein